MNQGCIGNIPSFIIIDSKIRFSVEKFDSHRVVVIVIIMILEEIAWIKKYFSIGLMVVVLSYMRGMNIIMLISRLIHV